MLPAYYNNSTVNNKQNKFPFLTMFKCVETIELVLSSDLELYIQPTYTVKEGVEQICILCACRCVRERGSKRILYHYNLIIIIYIFYCFKIDINVNAISKNRF